MDNPLESVKGKLQSISGFAKDQLEMIKQVTEFMKDLPKIMKDAPSRLDIAEMEIEPEDDNDSIYLTITLKDRSQYEFLKRFEKYEKILPVIIGQAYERMKSGEFDDLIEQAKEKAQSKSPFVSIMSRSSKTFCSLGWAARASHIALTNYSSTPCPFLSWHTTRNGHSQTPKSRRCMKSKTCLMAVQFSSPITSRPRASMLSARKSIRGKTSS